MTLAVGGLLLGAPGDREQRGCAADAGDEGDQEAVAARLRLEQVERVVERPLARPRGSR
jgi:hypothetical protein